MATKADRAVLDLDHTIRAWESSLFHDRFLMSPSTQVIVESTVVHLKKLKTLLGTDTQSEMSEKKLSENSFTGEQ